MMEDMLIFRTKNSRDYSKVMRVSENFDTLVNMIKIKTNLPAYEITRQIAVYLADRIVIEEETELPMFRKE